MQSSSRRPAVCPPPGAAGAFGVMFLRFPGGVLGVPRGSCGFLGLLEGFRKCYKGKHTQNLAIFNSSSTQIRSRFNPNSIARRVCFVKKSALLLKRCLPKNRLARQSRSFRLTGSMTADVVTTVQAWLHRWSRVTTFAVPRVAGRVDFKVPQSPPKHQHEYQEHLVEQFVKTIAE